MFFKLYMILLVKQSKKDDRHTDKSIKTSPSCELPVGSIQTLGSPFTLIKKFSSSTAGIWSACSSILTLEQVHVANCSLDLHLQMYRSGLCTENTVQKGRWLSATYFSRLQIKIWPFPKSFVNDYCFGQKRFHSYSENGLGIGSVQTERILVCIWTIRKLFWGCITVRFHCTYFWFLHYNISGYQCNLKS